MHLAEAQPLQVLFHFEVLSSESINLVLPSPACKAYPIAIACTTITQYMPPHRPPCCMPYTIQYW